MSNIKAIPFTEVVERVQDLSRSNTDTKQRIRGIVNEIYVNDIPNMYEWHWLKAVSSIACIAEYDTGYATVNTQNTQVIFSSGATITLDMTGRKLKLDDNPDIYDITYESATSVTISPPLSGESNISDGGYTIYKNLYSLPADFDRFPINGGLLFYSAGQPSPLPQVVDDDYYATANASPTTVPDSCRFAGYDTAGNLQVEVIPPPASPYILRNEYLKALPLMREWTAGTIVVGSSATAVGGTSTTFTKANTGDYLRADVDGKGPDSTWYRITAITNNTTLTISPAFKGEANYSGAYTICSVPQMPYRLHPALIYGSLQKILPDHKDPMFMASRQEFAKIVTDNKVLEQSRFAKDDVELIAEDYDYRW